MKKFLSMLAVSTLIGTSASNLKPLFTSNVSQGFKSNQKNNVYTHLPEPLWTDLKYQAKPNTFFQKMNDNQGIIDSECVDTKGNFRRLIYNEQDIFGTVFQFNSDISVMVDNNRNILLLDKNLKFTLLKNNVGYVVFEKMNDNLGLITFNKKTFLLNYLGQFTEIKKDNKDIYGQFTRMSDTMALFQEYDKKTHIFDSSYLLDISDPFKPNWTELKIKDLYQKQLHQITRMSDTMALFQDDNDSSYLLDISDPFKPNWTDLRKQGQFTRMSDTMALFQEYDKKTHIFDSSYLLDISDPFKPNWTELKLNDLNQKQFTRMSDTMALFQDDNDSSYLLDISDPFKPNWTELKLNGQAVKGEFSVFNIDILFFKSFIDKKCYFLSIKSDPKDIDALDKEINKSFIKTTENQYIIDINRPEYQGKISNNNIDFKIESSHIIEIQLNGKDIKKVGNNFSTEIINDYANTLKVISDFSIQLKPYNIYIKKQPTINNIKNVVGHQLTNYVGVFDNKNLSNEKIPNLQDITVSDSEVEINFNSNFVSDNKLYKIDKKGNTTEISNITSGLKLSKVDSYMLETKDLVTNISKQYLVIGTPTITDFRTTDQWKQAENWALKNGYKQSDLDRMNANEIKDLLSKYNPSPPPNPTPKPSNNIGWYIFLGVFLGLITFGIAGFYINKFVIKPIRNKRSDIKSDKYVAEQMELSKKMKRTRN